jgi:hypothetical protein
LFNKSLINSKNDSHSQWFANLSNTKRFHDSDNAHIFGVLKTRLQLELFVLSENFEFNCLSITEDFFKCITLLNGSATLPRGHYRARHYRADITARRYNRERLHRARLYRVLLLPHATVPRILFKTSYVNFKEN